VFTDTDGYFDTEREQFRPGGWISVEASAEGYAASRVDTQAQVDPDPDALVIRLVPGARVLGRILETDGAPVEGARVLWFDPDDESMGMPGEPYGTQPVSTDREGVFGFDAVPPGERVLLVEVTGRFSFLDGPFTVPESGTCPERTIVVPVGARLSGVVRSLDGEPLGGEEVTLYLVEGGATSFSWQSTTSDASGAFEFLDLPDGRYQISQLRPWSGGSHNVLATLFRIQDGVDQVVDLQPTGSCLLTGRLSGPREMPAEVLVMISPRRDSDQEPAPGTPTLFTAVAVDGYFELDGLPAGPCSVSVQASLPQAQILLIGSQNVTLAEGGTAHAEIEMKKAPRRR
jgi:hypothetical protein